MFCGLEKDVKDEVGVLWFRRGCEGEGGGNRNLAINFTAAAATFEFDMYGPLPN